MADVAAWSQTIPSADPDLEEATGLPDTDLGEATGLPDQTMAPAATTMPTSPCQYLGYGRLMARWTKTSRSDQTETSAPDMEARLAGQCELTGTLAAFWDGHGSYVRDTQKNAAFLDQVGLRLRPTDQTVLMVGKERNRRAPGLIVSPSDFLHSSQSLPGQQEDRRGVWAVRGSWQTSDQSVDLFLLPMRHQRDNGFPAEEQQSQGAVGRYFRQFANFDLDLGIGQVEGQDKAGISSQGFLSKAWKVYGEAGYQEGKTLLIWQKEHVVDTLLGSSFDGDKFALRLEFLRQNSGLRADEFEQLQAIRQTGRLQSSQPTASGSPMLLRQNYLIANLSLLEWPEDCNVQETVIFGLDDDAWMNLLRVEYLVNDRQVVGLTQRHWDRSNSHQFFMRPADWEALIDWKWSF